MLHLYSFKIWPFSLLVASLKRISGHIKENEQGPISEVRHGMLFVWGCSVTLPCGAAVEKLCYNSYTQLQHTLKYTIMWYLLLISTEEILFLFACLPPGTSVCRVSDSTVYSTSRVLGFFLQDTSAYEVLLLWGLEPLPSVERHRSLTHPDHCQIQVNHTLGNIAHRKLQGQMRLMLHWLLKWNWFKVYWRKSWYGNNILGTWNLLKKVYPS